MIVDAKANYVAKKNVSCTLYTHFEHNVLRGKIFFVYTLFFKKKLKQSVT
jgi:hypothetical protein